MALQMVRSPGLPLVTTTARDNNLAQEKIFGLVQRSERPGRPAPSQLPLVLSERELNALLSRHLQQVGEFPLSDVTVRLPTARRVEVAGRVPFRALVSEPPLTALGAALPKSWLERRVWLHFEADARVEPAASGRRRYLRLDVTRFAVGRQAFPNVLLRLVLDPAMLGLLRWPLPDAVADIVIEPGRAVIKTAS